MLRFCFFTWLRRNCCPVSLEINVDMSLDGGVVTAFSWWFRSAMIDQGASMLDVASHGVEVASQLGNMEAFMF